MLKLHLPKGYTNLALAAVLSLAIFLPARLVILKFILITLALIFASYGLGVATEELAAYYSSAVSGFLNATFGNLAELIIAFFVIKSGNTLLAQASLTGSILGNLVLLVGLAFFVASFKRKTIKLHIHQADTAATMLLTSVLFLLFPSMLYLFHEEAYAKTISVVVAAVLFSIYLLYLIFSFKTHKDWFSDNQEKHKPILSKIQAMFLMVATIVLLVALSENVSSIIETVAEHLHFNDLFLGAIILGFVGNAAENLAVVDLAAKGRYDFVLPIAVGSSLQIAMFVTPLLVFASLFMKTQLTLSFLPIEIFSILIAVLLANQIASDKKVTWFESIQLLGLYVIIAVVFYVAR